ncbi:DoxX family protein [Streptomyces sp. NPDC055037]
MNGTDTARILLRTTLGTVLLAHGVRHARSLPGTTRWFASLGMRHPTLQAVSSALVEVGAGAALVTGTLTPVASAATIGTMAVAARTVHVPNGFFITAEGYEYVLTLASAATALAALGPGPFSVDALLGVAERRKGPRWAAAAVALGVGAAAVQLRLFWSPTPPGDRPVTDPEEPLTDPEE